MGCLKANLRCATTEQDQQKQFILKGFIQKELSSTTSWLMHQLSSGITGLSVDAMPALCFPCFHDDVQKTFHFLNSLLPIIIVILSCHFAPMTVVNRLHLVCPI